MKYNELQATPNKNRRRSGRGEAAGRGKTAGRGTKGQNARSGGKRRPGFEGGQTPLVQRIPKVRGFRSIKLPVATITTDQLQNMKPKNTVTRELLVEEGVLSASFKTFKVVLGKQELKTKINVNARSASKNAIAAIEKAGGKFTQITISEEKETKNSKAKD